MSDSPVTLEGISASALPDLYNQFMMAVAGGDEQRTAALKQLQPMDSSQFQWEKTGDGQCLRLLTDRLYRTRLVVGDQEEISEARGIKSELRIYRKNNGISLSAIYPHSVSNNSGVPELKHIWTTVDQSGLVETVPEGMSMNLGPRGTVDIIDNSRRLLDSAYQQMLSLTKR